MSAVLAFLALLCLQAVSAGVVPKSLLQDGETARIIGGRNANQGQFPWAVALYFQNSFICTASIIGETSVLTAAHCVVDDNNQPRNPAEYYGIANFDRTASQVRLDFASLSVNPDYANLDNDIAIFRTQEPISFNNDVDKVCLAAMNTEKNMYRNATAMGWGNTNPFFVNVIPEILQHTAVRLRETCPLLGVTDQTSDKICAGGFLSAVCNGDSGGPLVHLSADQPPTQIGITSYGNALFGCGRSTLPAVFTRVSAFIEFITSSTQPDNLCMVGA